MELTNEDLLRLNVLMARHPCAIRIDENRMQVFGLTENGEARVDLNPTGRHEQYVRKVREFLSGHVFGSPGGYPVFINRWTRMGQVRSGNLQQLLMLGEPEAVTAVAHAEGLTPEVAHYAWWCMPESENARCMLEKEAIVNSELGPILADHLFEHLAFETEPKPMIESVRLILQQGLIDEDRKHKLWRASQRKNVYLIGFMRSSAKVMPHDRCAHEIYVAADETLKQLKQNRFAAKLLWALSEEGQGFLIAAYTVFKKPADQDVVVYLLDTMQEKMSDMLPIAQNKPFNKIQEISELTTQLLDTGSDNFAHADQEWKILVNEVSENHALIALLESLLWISQISESLITRIFSQTTAEGTLMRKKLKPVTEHIFYRFEHLLGQREGH